MPVSLKTMQLWVHTYKNTFTHTYMHTYIYHVYARVQQYAEIKRLCRRQGTQSRRLQKYISIFKTDCIGVPTNDTINTPIYSTIMAWAPSTSFEDELVSLQPDYNFIHGHLAYENRQKTEKGFTPRPQSTYDHLAKREKRNKEINKMDESKSREIRASLAMMERIQEIAGTKPLGEHATMSDWNDKSTVEREAVAMMRHFGMMSMSDGALEAPKTDLMPKTKIHVVRNGQRNFPLIMDPNYFEPGKTRKTNTESGKSASSNSSIYSNALEANTTNGTNNTLYITAQTHLDENLNSSSTESYHSYMDIPYLSLHNESDELSCPMSSQVRKKKVIKKRKNRPSQKERRVQQATNGIYPF